MKIAIISDTHDNLPNLQKTLKFCQKEDIAQIIHCGNVCSRDTLAEFSADWIEKFYLSFGNADFTKDLEFGAAATKKIVIFNSIGKAEIGGLDLAFCHFPEIASSLASQDKYDFVFHGHTHKPWLEQVGKSILACPGNVANLYFAPSFAILDTKTKKLELKLLNKI